MKTLFSNLDRSRLSKLLLALCVTALASVLWLTPKLASTVPSDHIGRQIVIRRSGVTSLVIYDGAPDSGDGLITARYVANLLGHFGIKPEIRHLSNYTPELLQQFNATFVCGTTAGTVMPASLLSDVGQSDKTVCWINRHLGQLTSQPDIPARLGLSFSDFLDDEEYETVSYRGISLPKADREINTIKINDRSRVQVLATARDPHGEIPYAMRSGSFWYFADSVFGYNTESDRSIVFADLLHEILNQPHPRERRAMVRIEDVSADSNPADLRRVADVLNQRGIPFQVALIPIYKDPGRRVELYLSDRPEVVEALHYMIARGGAIVLHGVTHQLHAASADDFEFWDALNAKPTADSSQEAMAHKLEAALDECFRVGLYPIAWETPHYTASLAHYRSLAQVFTHAYERRMVVDQSGTEQFFPYEAEDFMGQSIIPENLGYVNGEDPDPEKIVEAARRLLAVRDPIASFFFHPYLESSYLETATDALRRQGYQFISAKQFGCGLMLGDYAVATSPRSIESSPTHRYLRRVSLDASGRELDHFEKAERGQTITQRLEPASGGLVAVQGVARPPVERPSPGLLEQAKAWLAGKDVNSLPAPRIRARRALLLAPQSSESDRDIAGFQSLLDVFGVPFARISLSTRQSGATADLSDQLRDDTVVIVPRSAAASLTEQDRDRLVEWIERGGRAVIEGRSELSEQLGFAFSSRMLTVSHARDLLFPDSEITWAHPAEVDRFEPPPVSTTLVEDSESKTPLAVASRAGDGLIVYFATELDPETGLGYSRYPYAFEHLRQRFGLAPPVTASGAEFYFDPGFREQAQIEKLVASWQRDGIRAVYAAAWQFYPKWSYDYDRLIRLCHERGIAVYAWFELPQVSQKFWDEHPEWREKTATGRDTDAGWRKMMNLANDDCRASVLDFVTDLIDSHDWDGVNIAELGFDTNGLGDAAAYAPMNDDVRARFQLEAGFDPKLLFDPLSPFYLQKNADALARWSKFRSNLVREWLVAVLDRVGEARTRKQLDVICTALDSLHNPRVVEKTGADVRDVIALMERYDFTLQVEDPAERWGNSPTRYREFGETYSKVVSDRSRLMFDINVVRDRVRGMGPTDLMSGTELALAAASAIRAGNGRVAIYSEASLRPEDRALLAIVLGSAARLIATDPTAVAINKTVRVQLRSDQSNRSNGVEEGPNEPAPVLDGERWQGGDNGEIIVPAGEHRIGGPARAERFTDRLGIGVRVKDITADVNRVERTSLGVAIDYSSPRRSWVTVSREPHAVRVDGRSISYSFHHGGSGWLIELPAGNHVVEIEDATAVSAAVDVASVISSRSIVWLGERFLLLLASLYGAIRIRRSIRRLASPAKSDSSKAASAALPLRDSLVSATPRSALANTIERAIPLDQQGCSAESEPELLELAR